MHYKNGREAKNGDKVVLIPAYGSPIIGVLYDAVAGNDHCNGKIAVISVNDRCPDLKECLHLDDVLKALPITVPDSSKCGHCPAENPHLTCELDRDHAGDQHEGGGLIWGRKQPDIRDTPPKAK